MITEHYINGSQISYTLKKSVPFLDVSHFPDCIGECNPERYFQSRDYETENFITGSQDQSLNLILNGRN
jgi:hypothetical protein